MMKALITLYEGSCEYLQMEQKSMEATSRVVRRIESTEQEKSKQKEQGSLSKGCILRRRCKDSQQLEVPRTEASRMSRSRQVLGT